MIKASQRAKFRKEGLPDFIPFCTDKEPLFHCGNGNAKSGKVAGSIKPERKMKSIQRSKKNKDGGKWQSSH
jgi:hypothetical protein